MKVSIVEALPNYVIQVTFDNSVSGIVSLNDFVKTGIFATLQNEDFFKKVYTNGYSIAWNDELEIDALTIYAELLNKDPEEILANSLNYAAN